MDLYNKKDKSLPQKILLISLEILILWISYMILFSDVYNKIFTSQNHVQGNHVRHIILFVLNLVVFFRISITIFYLIKRHIPWEEAFSVPFAFAVYYIGFALLGYKTQKSIDFIDIVAIILFICGSLLNTGSELMRDKWKKNPEHKGQLYTAGLFKYSMHINFFGDIIWVLAYAVITRNWYAGIIPLLLFFFFAFYNIPKLDKYLAEKYKQQFEEYRDNTKKLVPFIY